MKRKHSHADHHKHPSKRAKTPQFGNGERFSRKQKFAIHGALLLIVVASLLHEGGGLADWSFLGLAFATEVA